MITALDLKLLRADLTRAGVFERRAARGWLKLTALLVSFALLVAAAALLPWWCAFLLVPLAAFPAASAAMIGHEAAHGSFADGKLHNEVVLHLVFPLFGGLGVQHWKNKHNRRHHAHPNVVGRDPDIEIWPMALSSVAHAGSGRVRRRLQRVLQGYMFWPFTLLLAFAMRYESIGHLVGRIRAGTFDRWVALDIACLVAHYTLWLVLPSFLFGFWPVAALYVGLWATVGVLLAAVFMPAHVGLPLMEGEERGGWLHQLQTTRNLAMPRWLSWFFVGLDYQVEHHLFPKIPHHNLALASQIVSAWCKRLDVPHQSVGYISGLAEVTRHVHAAWRDVPVQRSAAHPA